MPPLPPPPPGWDPSQNVAPPPPPPPPPGSQAFATVGAQGRAIISRLDPTGIRPTLYVGAVLLVLVFGSVLLNGILPARAAPSGPGPVVSDKAHAYISNETAGRTGQQPNLPVADLIDALIALPR